MIELLIVVGIIGLLLVLMAPAFTTIKGGTDVTSAAYTIKGVLDTARTYAKAKILTPGSDSLRNVANPASPNSDAPAVGRAHHVHRWIKRWNHYIRPYKSWPTGFDQMKLTQVGKENQY